MGTETFPGNDGQTRDIESATWGGYRSGKLTVGVFGYEYGGML